MNKNEQYKKKPSSVLLIAGHPRSGTTLLFKVCNTHPQIAVTQEFKCYLKLNSSAEEHLKAIKKRGQSWHKVLMTLQIAPRVSGKSLFGSLRSLRISLLYRWRMQAIGSKEIKASDVTRELARVLPDASIVGDKYPGYVFKLDRLLDIPSVQIVVIHRDCRDVVSSCRKKSQGAWRGTSFGQRLGTPDGAAKNWVKAVKSMERNSDRIHIIPYESLVSNPGTELASLGKWLGVQANGFDPSIIHKDSIGRHRDELSANDLSVIDEIAGEQLRKLGYCD